MAGFVCGTFIIFLFSAFLVRRIAASDISGYIQEPVPLFNYNGYKSVEIIQFTVPDLCEESSWQFVAIQEDQDCPTKLIDIYLNYGAYPVVAPKHEAFPQNFFLPRENLYHLPISSENLTRDFQIKNPLPGNWYTIAYVLDSSENEQEDNCMPTLRVKHVVKIDAPDDVEDLSVDVSMSLYVNKQKQYRYFLPIATWRYEIYIDECSYNYTLNENGSVPLENNCTDNCTEVLNDCPLILAVRPKALNKLDGSSQTINCSKEETCVMTIDSSSLLPDEWQYLDVIPIHSNITVDFKIKIQPQECLTFISGSNNEQEFHNTRENITQKNCVLLQEFWRYLSSERLFQVKYLKANSSFFPILHDNHTQVMRFTVKEHMDTGGTLKFKAILFKQNYTQHVQVEMCVQHGYMPVNQHGVYCHHDNKIILNSTGVHEKAIYFPYPKAGKWFIGIHSFCYNDSGHTEQCENSDVDVDYMTEISECVDGGCTDNGLCRLYSSGTQLYSSCSCIAGWRGYGCTDGSKAKSYETQMIEVLLLTMSNLMFLPVIIVSLHRRFYTEALVFFYTMFMSTFYHACDGDRTQLYCMMPYATLINSDFYGAILSFWVTLIKMAHLPNEKFRCLLYILGALGISVGVQWDRHSLWSFLVPCLTAFLILAISWGRQMQKRHRCFPGPRRYLLLLLPGALIAGLGLLTKQVLSTYSNYKYTHSAWHACIAISVLFLLPPRQKDATARCQTDDIRLESGRVSELKTQRNIYLNGMENGAMDMNE